MKLAFGFLVFSVVALGCSSSSSTPESDAGTGGGAGNASAGGFDPVECRAVAVQSDLLSQSPEGPEKPPVKPYWFGPGVDKTTGKPIVPAGAIVTTTYLQLRTEPASQKRFGELSGPIVGTLMASPGLVGASIVLGQKCQVARTLVVWKDEASMLAFVSSKAHSDAIGAVGEVSRGGSITTNWVAEGEPSFEVAAKKLEGHKGPVY